MELKRISEELGKIIESIKSGQINDEIVVMMLETLEHQIKLGMEEQYGKGV